MKPINILVILLSFVLTSCYYDVEDELYPNNCVTPAEILYSVDVAPIISNNCAVSGCHVTGGTVSINFENIEELISVANNGTLYIEVIQDRTMPPNSAISNCDKEIIQKWIESGAPNN